MPEPRQHAVSRLRDVGRPGSETASVSHELPDDKAAQLHLQLYNKLATALSLRGVVGQDSKSLLSLQVPGLDIRPGMDPKDPRTQYYVSNALDRTLLCSWEVVQGSATITDVYKAILDGKETPVVSLSPEQRAQLDRAELLLTHADGQPTEKYIAYEARQLAYLTALDDYEAAAATYENGGPPVPKTLLLKLLAAEKAWANEGFKREVESAMAVIEALEGLEPAHLWRKLATRFRDYTRELDPAMGSQFQYVTSNPPYEQWFDSNGWSDFRFDPTDFENQKGTGGGGLNGAGCCCCGCHGTNDALASRARSSAFLASRPAEGGPDDPLPFSPTAFKLTARLRRIDIIRPWLDANIFYSRAWRWSEASVAYGVVVSTGGDVAGRLPPTGVMPVLPTTAILAADIAIAWDDGDVTLDQVRRRLSQGHEVRIGPFRLTELPAEHHEITIPGPQLIGFVSQLIPKCPNPDPLLTWPLQVAKSGLWPL